MSTQLLTQGKKAWEQYLEKDVLDPRLVRSSVASSWQRCRSLHLNPLSISGGEADELQKLEQRRSEKEQLLRVARPFLRDLAHFVTGSDFEVILTDEDGLLLEVAGDAQIAARARQVHLCEGANWSEAARGTNAIGTAIFERAPVQIHAWEHFFAENQFLTCSAAPIIDPIGNIVGVIDISGDCRHANPHTLGMVVAAVHAIENQLRLEQAMSRLTMHSSYFDNNSTTPVLPEVLDAMLPCFAEAFGNASSIHAYGRRALAHLKQARENVAALLGCRATEVVFTSGGTEGDNLALKGMVQPGDHLIVSAIEHSAILSTCAWLEQMGCTITRIGVDSNGQVDPDAIRRAIRPSTRLISIMMANNETGVLQPVEEVGKIAAEADIWFHTDAVQAAGKVPIAVDTIRCDLLTISAHKIHGPQGVGALYVRRGTPLRPQLHGGHQEKSRRPGTENVPGIAGLGAACALAVRGLSDGSIHQIAALRNRLEDAIVGLVPHTRINGKDSPRVPNTSNILFEHVGGDSLVLALDEAGVIASRGAACTAGEADPSSVLMAMGLSGEQSRSSLRFSLGKQNTNDDVDQTIATLPAVVERLRSTSPFAWTSREEMKV